MCKEMENKQTHYRTGNHFQVVFTVKSLYGISIVALPVVLFLDPVPGDPLPCMFQMIPAKHTFI